MVKTVASIFLLFKRQSTCTKAIALGVFVALLLIPALAFASKENRKPVHELVVHQSSKQTIKSTKDTEAAQPTGPTEPPVRQVAPAPVQKPVVKSAPVPRPSTKPIPQPIKLKPLPIVGSYIHSQPNGYGQGINNITLGPGQSFNLNTFTGQTTTYWQPEKGSFVWQDGQTQSPELPYYVTLNFPKSQGSVLDKSLSYMITTKNDAAPGVYPYSFYVHGVGSDILSLTVTITN